jgi:hypothetical protein
MDPQRYEYSSVANCPGALPGSPGADDFCPAAVAACSGNSAAQGTGPSVRLYRRQVDAAGTPTGPWVELGATCFATAVPGKPVLGMAQVLDAFRQTDFARPALAVEPRGDVTLVSLPTYFEVVWPESGFQPGEVDRPDPAKMLGYRVDIRPLLRSVTYHFGDGMTAGPTGSLGGPYPSGDITHAYATSGDYPVRADVTYAGQYRVNGGRWLDIPDTVTIRGMPHTLHVKTARARLYTH